MNDGRIDDECLTDTRQQEEIVLDRVIDHIKHLVEHVLVMLRVGLRFDVKGDRFLPIQCELSIFALFIPGIMAGDFLPITQIDLNRFDLYIDLIACLPQKRP